MEEKYFNIFLKKCLPNKHHFYLKMGYSEENATAHQFLPLT